tara:strand:- start:2267 stop:2500 length:234 start_codon:yes stop_codon:yes gene_type:complete
MKTAITSVLEDHRKRMHETNQGETAFWYLTRLIKDLEKMLPVEKEHLEQFHMFGQKSAGIDSSYSDAQNKFTKTYEQ